MNTAQKNKKAVGLLSGGLDSTVAAKLIKDLGFDVYGIHFRMPWGAAKYPGAQKAAEAMGIRFQMIQLDNDYLEILKKPKHGYGSAFNPCIDCHVYMIAQAGKYMKEIGAEFVFTGEVLGQRPMSQLRRALTTVEERSGLKGRLLRPLSAKHLPATIAEEEGTIDREKLLDISGRSRKEQIRLAQQLGIKDYPNAAGGCLLTDKNFGRRMKDALDHGCHDYTETVLLQWGRHFRFNKHFKMILGRDEGENIMLKKHARPGDHILELKDKRGPTLILQGNNPPAALLAQAAGFIQYFSKAKDAPPKIVEYWTAEDPGKISFIEPVKISQENIKIMKI